MWQTLVQSFVIGLFGGNALPHFIKGLTREAYPNVLGNGPVPNLVSGWVGLVLTALLIHCTDWASAPAWSFAAAAAGLLAIGLFHAGPGAFGRKPRSAERHPVSG